MERNGLVHQKAGAKVNQSITVGRRDRDVVRVTGRRRGRLRIFRAKIEKNESHITYRFVLLCFPAAMMFPPPLRTLTHQHYNTAPFHHGISPSLRTIPNRLDAKGLLSGCGSWLHAGNTTPSPAASSQCHMREQWLSGVLDAIREHFSASVLNQTELRPLKPNDDNYAAFVGEQWKPSHEGLGRVPPELAALIGVSQGDPTPHCDRCAACTAALNERFSRCRFVKCCSHGCQAKHWNSCHKKSCLRPHQRTLLEAMQTNDGFTSLSG
jgi:hypothetical protein